MADHDLARAHGLRRRAQLKEEFPTVALLPREREPPKEDFTIRALQPRPQSLDSSSCIISIGEVLQTIYCVPEFLRDLDESAYNPQIVSLGPYHHGRPQLRKMDDHKQRILHHTLVRTGHDIGLYYNAVRSIENRARDCYEAPLSISTEAFVKCLVVDSIFVLELFRSVAGEGLKRLGYSSNDPVFAAPDNMPLFRRDMIILENQLPFFVLEHILALQLGHEPSRVGLLAPLALRFFDPLRPTSVPLPSTASLDLLSHAGSNGTLHCLDMFRRSILLTGPKPVSVLQRRHKRCLELIYSVTKLHKAGIKFKPRTTNLFWDIEFKDGVLQIPNFLIHNNTKSLFLNLIAFERCHLEESNHYISAYVSFMDKLIRSEEDVRYLHNLKIIENYLGSDKDVVNLFNQFPKDLMLNIDCCYLSELSDQLYCYYNRRWNGWRAILKREYFNNPWIIISFLAAMFLLSVSFV